MSAIKDNDECVKEWKYSQGVFFGRSPTLPSTGKRSTAT